MKAKQYVEDALRAALGRMDLPWPEKALIEPPRERKFGDIWQDTSNPIMAGLKDRKPLLKGRCAKCKWLDNCNGNFRTRAEARTGDFWESDPSCYLTDEEIGLTEEKK